jgi:Flp pilus assembly protein TadG
MVVAFLFALGVLSIQFFGLGMTAFKVNHAAQEAAYVAASGLEAAGNRTPCWAVTGGLAHPDGYSDAAICRTVLENLGDLKPANVTVSVSPTLLERTKRSPIHVTVSYREPITSPLLRAFIGDTFTTSADASSWSQ